MHPENQNALALTINKLSVKYGDTPALSGITLKVNAGDYLGVIGPNGGGKSTLLKAIMGLVKTASGNIKVSGHTPGYLHKNIGYVPQTSDVDKSFPINVQEVVLTGMLVRGFPIFRKYSQEEKEAADNLLNEVGVYALKKRHIKELSGGEFQKILIARALAVNPGLLLLDEPTSSVDSNSRDQIYNLLETLNTRMTIILVTHDLLAISAHVGVLACLNRQLVYHGKAELNSEIVRNMYNCPVDLIAHGVPHRVLKEHVHD